MSATQVGRFGFGDGLTPTQGAANAILLIQRALDDQAAHVVDGVVTLGAPMTLWAAVELGAAITQIAAQALGCGADEVLDRVSESVLKSFEAAGGRIEDARVEAPPAGVGLLSEHGGVSLPRSQVVAGQAGAGTPPR